MIEVRAEINDDLFKRAMEQLSPSKVVQALRMALNDSVVKGRTMVRRSIQEVYNIKAARINDSNSKRGLSLKKATNSELQAEIRAGHIPLKLSEMNPKYTGSVIARNVSFKGGNARKGKLIKRSTSAISVEVIKGQRKTLGSAFTIGVATNRVSGQQFATSAIFARGKKGKPGFQFGKARFPIDSISSVSVATAATNTKSLDKYQDDINKYATDRFIHHVERLLKAADNGGSAGV